MVRFVLLAYGITWVGVAPLVLSHTGVGPPLPAWLHGVGALGPLAAAWLSPRDHGVFSRSREPALSPAWRAACLLTPLLFAAVALAVSAVRGADILAPLAEAFRSPAWLASLVAGSVLYGLGEGPGWRGWLLPRLQRRLHPVRATLILAVIWAGWHAPFFAYRFQLQGTAAVAGFFVGLLAGAFWLTFLFNATGGSVRIVAGWHVLWNVANIGLLAVSDEAVAVLNALMMVLGFGVLLVFGRRGLAPDGSVISA